MSSSEFLTPSFVGGWATVLAIAGTIGYNYYQKQKPASAPSKTTQVPWSPPKKGNRAKKQRQEAYATAAQNAPREETPRDDSVVTSSKKKERDEDADNKAFARQMSGVQEGVKFTGKKADAGKKSNKQKSVKQSLAAEPSEVTQPIELTPAVPEQAPAEESSSSNADADDDRSPVVKAADASGVSDMLEPSAPGPSVLRLTDTDKQKSKPKVAKAAEPVETKKQRQNRRKVEERKAVREEEERLRKIAMEKQRRGAREAAGIPAKDGTQFMAATNGGKSAWKAGSPQEGQKETIDVQPLDTFETTTTNGTAASVAPAQNKQTDGWKASALSEEEQIELIKEDDEWATVPTKSSKKAKKSQGSDTEAAPAPPSAPPKEARPVPQPIVNKTNSAKANQSYGSFSALSSKVDDNAQEEETEWDV
ncbi:hypothetical protein VD0002_g9966 [Verticillium dahliae]|uniref:Uncharacterized protein n=1 Tax=Verticillium dahliae TaxID=27337 RepID=A0AA44WHA0_VERDA|nr:hypothetical protein BJF96_g7457 [Verticillium dahliae]PNH46149.1 hypothetical protein VD0003_g9071 [Verticillium dahliae]PNH54698.1 hypothetical protein VD0002_g9966 [Verticillium dahliae]